MRRIGAAMGLLVVFALSVSVAESASPYRVRSYIQPDKGITEQQAVRLVIEVEGQQRAQLAVTGLNDLTNLRVVGGPERVFNMNWENDRMSSRTSLVYTLLPEAAGTALIPALALDVDGKRMTTQPIRFEVGAAPAGVPPAQRGGSRGGRVEERADVFLRAELGAKQVWQGQSVPLTLLLYSAERIVSRTRLAGEPALSSFWVEDIEVDSDREARRTTVRGQPYVVYPMRRQMLVPQVSGKLPIEPFILQIPIRVRGGDPFESFFSFGRSQTVVRKSLPLELEVRPLPTAGRPDDFGGAVGSFELKLAMDREEASVDDAIALTATVEGEGFLRAVAPPSLDTPPDIKVYDPIVSATSRSVDGKLMSRKTWEWNLVPLVAGELQIPTMRFPYFDTESGSYRVATADPAPLVVRANGDAPEQRVARGDIQLQRRDLAFIKPLRGSLHYGTLRVHRRSVFLSLLLLPVVWVPLVILLGRHRATLQQNLGLARSRRARSRARQRLRAVRKRLATSDATSFHEEVALALVHYVADRFDRSAAGLTYEVADDLLASRGIDEPLRLRFRGCLETCDFARFVPASGGSERRAELLGQAEALIAEMEKAL